MKVLKSIKSVLPFIVEGEIDDKESTAIAFYSNGKSEWYNEHGIKLGVETSKQLNKLLNEMNVVTLD